MKFGVITYHNKLLKLSGNEGQNIGDWVQTIAAETFPLPDKIIPLFFGFHLHDRVISENVLSQFKEYEPVGCKEEETLFNMRELGIRKECTECRKREIGQD